MSESPLGTSQKEYMLLWPQVEGRQDDISDGTRHLSLGHLTTTLVSRIRRTCKVVQLILGKLQHSQGYTVT